MNATTVTADTAAADWAAFQRPGSWATCTRPVCDSLAKHREHVQAERQAAGCCCQRPSDLHTATCPYRG